MCWEWECEFKIKSVSILEDFPIASLEDQFGESDVIIMDDKASCHWFRRVKHFLSENNAIQMEWTACSPDINPIENMLYFVKNGI